MGVTLRGVTGDVGSICFCHDHGCQLDLGCETVLLLYNSCSCEEGIPAVLEKECFHAEEVHEQF